MLDSLTDSVNGIMGSPWIYLALFGIAALDGFFPVVPSETLVITAGVYAAAHGKPNLVLVALVAALGALAGDHTSYAIGRLLGKGVVDRAAPGSRRRRAFDWARRALRERGGLILLIARYIPGGRTAATLTMGGVHYRLRSFTPFDAIAAASWGVYCVLLGYIGGRAFEGNAGKGLLLGLGIALAVTVVIELVRRLRNRRAARSRSASPPDPVCMNSRESA